MSKIMVALGGNALGNTPKEQFELVENTAKSIVDLIEEGNEVIVSHGNGPQIGMINLAFEHMDMPFPECGAMSQGYIGYHLQNRIGHELSKRRIEKNVATIITQTLVDEGDKAFDNPTKPIGKFYSEDEARQLEVEKGFIMGEDSNRGYRRMVPSPRPTGIVELPMIKDLVNLGYVVIASGGGGIPTITSDKGYVGVPAVIDKDLASSKLADLLDCDKLIIFTAVERVAINFGKENQEDLSSMTIADCERYISEGQFAKGSMLPKVQAAMEFVNSKAGRVSVIASLEKSKETIKGQSGTEIHN